MATTKTSSKKKAAKKASPKKAVKIATPSKVPSTNRLVLLNDGRQSFASNGMRDPVAKNGPYVGQKFLVKPGKPDRNAISKKVADTSVSHVLEAWKGAQCGGVSEAERLANLKAFYNFIYGFELTGNDVWSVLKVAEKVLPVGYVKLPSRSKTRLDRLNITKETKGTRGKGLNKIMPSFMWQFLVDNCEHLKQINQFLAGISKEKFGIDLNKIPDYSSYKVPDSELINLVEGVDTSGNCAQNRGWWKRLLKDVNQLQADKKFDGSDLEAYFHYFTMITGNRVINPAKFNVDEFKFRPQAVSKSTRKPASAARVKASLLWYLVENFCENLPIAVTLMEKLYNITPATKKTTKAKFIGGEPPKRAPLPYVDATQARKRKSTLAKQAVAPKSSPAVASPRTRPASPARASPRSPSPARATAKPPSPARVTPKSPSPRVSSKSKSPGLKMAPKTVLATRAAKAAKKAEAAAKAAVADAKAAKKAQAQAKKAEAQAAKAAKAASPKKATKAASPKKAAASPKKTAASPKKTAKTTDVTKAKAKAIKDKSKASVIPSPIVRAARTPSGKKTATPTRTAPATASKANATKAKGGRKSSKKTPKGPGKSASNDDYYDKDGAIRVYFDGQGRAHDYNGAFIKATKDANGRYVGVPK